MVASWPSVARCAPDEIPSDQWACDHSNEMRRHNHDGTLGLDLQPEDEEAADEEEMQRGKEETRPGARANEEEKRGSAKG